MSDHCTRFEHLPNEIIGEIFAYIDTQHLFRTFHNLNTRLNEIIESLNNNYLFLTTTDCTQIRRYQYLAPFIRILLIEGRAQLNLNYFTNVRYLILVQSSDELIEQLEYIYIPRLEHLVVVLGNRHENEETAYYWNRIFSFDYPHLKVCCLHKVNLRLSCSTWRSMLSLQILKLGDIDIIIYALILSSCPNLCSFKFTRLVSNYRPANIIQHTKLKTLTIVIPWFEDFSQNDHMTDFIAYVPNLEQLTIHRTNESKCINESYLKFDWYSAAINLHLPVLSRFVYYLHVLKSDRFIQSYMQNLLTQIQEHFRRLHRRLVQSRLILDLIG